MRKVLWMALAVAVLAAPAAQAATITFGPGAYGSPVGPTAEGNFTYDTFSGGLFRDGQGNGDAYAMEGCSACGGGVLRIVRNDVLGGAFTFDGADVMYQFGAVYPISFSGYLNGALVGTDVFQTLGNSTYSTHGSLVLAGLAIDELRVQLDAASSFATVIDNVVVTPTAVPEPSTLLLLGAVFSGLAARRSLRARR
jgi:hypothetical protein